MRIPIAAAGLAAMLAACPAAAQSFSDWEVGNWAVSSEDGDCAIVHTAEDRRQLGVIVTRTDRDFYVQVAMPGTSGMAERQAYPVSVTVGGQRYESDGYRLPNSGAVGTMLRSPSPEVMKAFARADRIAFTVPSAGTFEVAIDPEAKRQFLKCEASIGGAGSAAKD